MSVCFSKDKQLNVQEKNIPRYYDKFSMLKLWQI